MAKDKTVNPAQAQRKAEKQKFLKKGKAEQAARRNERLSQRNPERLQRQIDELHQVQESGRALNARDKKTLEDLERDVKAVRKAREAAGDKAPQFNQHRRNEQQERRQELGKRRRHEDGDSNNINEDGVRNRESNRSTPEDVRDIPMPGDTPPPVPEEYKHLIRPRGPHALPQKPAADVPEKQRQTTYEAKPIVRDLRREAVSAFVPAAVRAKQKAVKGQGGALLEPEEADQLEKEGYGDSKGADEGEGQELADLEEEERRFRAEMKQVQMEEVEDEDA